jgi:hypothetical protein
VSVAPLQPGNCSMTGRLRFEAVMAALPPQIKGFLSGQPRTSPRGPHERHGQLHLGRDRLGTIRTDFVGDLRFRMRSHVILEGLPIAPLILYFLARQADGQQSL